MDSEITPSTTTQTTQDEPGVSQPPSVEKNKHALPVIALLIVFIGLGSLALWYFQSASKKSEALVSKSEPSIGIIPQKIIVGTDPTYPSMEYKEDDILMGYDIDLATFIGRELGAQIEFKDIVFDDLFPALEKEEIDMIISTVTVTDERKQKYDFSKPYLQGGQVILTQTANNTITSTADLKGKKIGVQRGTTNETEALRYTSDDLVIRYPDFVEATTALVNQDVDAVLADLPGAKGITDANPILKIASDPFTNEHYAIVFRKGDPRIKEVNEALSALKVKGILTDLRQKWLNQ